jgi:hypothetical protein
LEGGVDEDEPIEGVGQLVQPLQLTAGTGEER